MNFSLILPSRGRPKLLRQFLESVLDTAEGIDGVEVLIAIDEDNEYDYDDPFFDSLPWCLWHLWDRKKDLTSYYNDLARRTRGNVIWALNDDCRIVTKGWDSIRTAGAWYGQTTDTNNEPYSCFPMLSRKAYDAQGYFFHPHFAGWGADQGLYRTWHGLSRVVKVPVMVEHLSYHHGNREKDTINEEVQAMSQPFHNDPERYFAEIMPGEIDRLRRLV